MNGEPKEESEEERRRTLEWLAQYGQLIADSMFRDAGLFYEEGARKASPESATKPPSGLTTFLHYFLPSCYWESRKKRKGGRM